MTKESSKTKGVRTAVSKVAAGRSADASNFLTQLKHDRGLWFLIYFAVIIAFLLLNQGGSIDLEKAPIWAFRTMAFGGFILFSILDSRRIRERISGVNLLGVLPITLAVYLVTANIVTHRPFETFEETLNILSYCSIVFLCYVYVDSLTRLRQFIEIIIVAGFVIAFHGLFIFYGALWSGKGTTPLSSLFYWHNQAAGFFLLIWPSMLAQFYSIKRPWQMFLILYVFYFTFTAFLLTLSRGAWLAGFIPFLAIPFILSRRKLMVSWRPLILVILYFISAIPFVLKYRGKFFQPIIDRWNQMRLDDYSVVGRFEFWNIAWRVFLEHPIFGIGFNAFGYYYVHYQRDPQYFTKDPHNVYLRFLVEGGIIGGTVILCVLLIAIRLIVRALKEDSGKLITVYRIGLAGGIVGELLHMAIDFDWTFPILPLLVLCQIAILARTFHFPIEERNLTVEQWEPQLKTSQINPDAGFSERNKGFFINKLWLWRTLAAILMVVNLLGFLSMSIYEKGKHLFDNQDRIARERAIAGMSQLEKEAFLRGSMEDLVSSGIYGEARVGVIREGMKYWRTSLIFNPWNWYPLKDLVSTHLSAASEMHRGGRSKEAEEVISAGLRYAKRLLKVTPYRPATYYYVGQLEILAGRLRNDSSLKESGLKKLLHSIELDPKNIPRYYLGIAQYYYEENQFEKSLEYLNQIEKIFVPLKSDGTVDLGALKGKSLARQDWIDITETLRDTWWLKGIILDSLGKHEEALIPLYNGLNTPIGGGPMAEQHLDLGLLQLPFCLKIASIQKDLGNWLEVYRRAEQAKNIVDERKMFGTPESRKAYELYNLAQSRINGFDEGLLEGESAN